MKVLIRTDSSFNIGTGHVARCLTLAAYLRNTGATVKFVCRPFHGANIPAIVAAGYEVSLVRPALEDGDNVPRQGNCSTSFDAEKVDWLSDAEAVEAIIRKWCAGPANLIIVDHYGLDRNWEMRLRDSATKFLVIDDLANRPHDCDFLLDQNLFENQRSRYTNLVPIRCNCFFGPRHALLRPEFYALRKTVKPRQGKVDRVLVSFGGSDASNQTTKAIDAFSLLNSMDRRPISVDLLIGAANRHRDSIQDLASQLPSVTVHIATNRVANLMASADLAVGAGA